jgi:hypothetical protein
MIIKCHRGGPYKLHKSSLAERLAAKIKKELNIECDATTFRRTYAGYWQRRSGAFSWTMQTRELRVIGSCERASECVKRKYKLIIDCDEIFIENREVC